MRSQPDREAAFMTTPTAMKPVITNKAVRRVSELPASDAIAVPVTR